MDKNTLPTPLEKASLTIIRKNEKKGLNAKLIVIKKSGPKPQQLLPPPQEKYIKAKEHDFL